MKNKIAILGVRGMLNKKIIDMLHEKFSQYVVDGFNENIIEYSFGEKTCIAKTFDSFDFQQYDIIVNFSKEMPVQEQAKWVDVPTSATPSTQIASIFLNTLQAYEPALVHISACDSISDFGIDAMHAFFKEQKISNMQQLNKGLFFEDPIAMNVVSDSVRSQKMICDLKAQFNCAITAQCFRVPVTIGNCISINFKLNKKISANYILQLLEKNNITYAHHITPLMVMNEDSIFATQLVQDDDVYSIVLVFDNLLQATRNILNCIEKHIA